MYLRRFIAFITAAAMLVLPIGAAEAKTKYAKTEMDKAIGKCIGSVLGGALLGALAGKLIGGKGAVATGAAVGVAAGGVICAALIASARHKDEMLAAQRDAVMGGPNTVKTVSWTGDDGQAMTFTTRSGADQQFDGARLVPVKYTVGGEKMESPVYTAGQSAICRSAATTINGQAGPPQLWCRSTDGNYAPPSAGQPSVTPGQATAHAAPICRATAISTVAQGGATPTTCRDANGDWAPQALANA